MDDIKIGKTTEIYLRLNIAGGYSFVSIDDPSLRITGLYKLKYGLLYIEVERRRKERGIINTILNRKEYTYEKSWYSETRFYIHEEEIFRCSGA